VEEINGLLSVCAVGLLLALIVMVVAMNLAYLMRRFINSIDID
jgi:hypothetical protein